MADVLEAGSVDMALVLEIKADVRHSGDVSRARMVIEGDLNGTKVEKSHIRLMR